MGSAFSFMRGDDAAIFTAALAIMIGLGVLAAAGFGDFDADFDVDGGGGLLDWLGLGRMTFLVFLIALLASFGVIGLVGQQIAIWAMGGALTPFLAIPAALLLALPATSGNLAGSAVQAALRYRAQAPVIDGLMKELGFDGGSLDGLVAGAARGVSGPVQRGDSGLAEAAE